MYVRIVPPKPMKKRKVFVPTEPREPLTPDRLEEIMKECDRAAEAMRKRLERLDYIPPEVWKMRVK